MRYNGKEYKLVKVYKDEVNELKDVLLFKCEYGYYECFQYFDLIDYTKGIKKRVWDDKDVKQIREYIRQGLKPKEITKKVQIKNKTRSNVYSKASYEQEKYEKGVWV